MMPTSITIKFDVSPTMYDALRKVAEKNESTIAEAMYIALSRYISEGSAEVEVSGSFPELMVSDLGLSARTRNALVRAGILTTSDIDRCRNSLYRINNFGVVCLRELTDALRAIGADVDITFWGGWDKSLKGKF